MKLPKTVALVTMFVPLVFGCASSTYESNNNNHLLNNNNPGIDGSTTGCTATCAGNNVCVGQPDHQSCVPACEEGLTCTDSLRTCCYGGCVDLQNDPNNCGSCAEFCDGNCINGVCVDQCGNMCSTDQVCCNGTCTNTMTDMNNCGACGSPCDAEEANACVNGTCKCGTSNACDLSSGAECCTTSCKFVATDVTNCGGCNIACSIGETCDSGNCMCGTGPACTGSQGCCNQSCVDLNTAQYCGSCTVSCGNNEECFSGTCGCGSAGTTCGTDLLGNPIECCGASGCVVMNSLIVIGINNCGTCGNNCPMGVPCIMGTCDAS